MFADLRGPEPGVPDGMKVDVEGNVYCGGAGGIWIMDAAGKKLGRIVHGAPATTNLAFGGDDWKTLYFTSRNHLGAVKVKIPGIRGTGRGEMTVPRLIRCRRPPKCFVKTRGTMSRSPAVPRSVRQGGFRSFTNAHINDLGAPESRSVAGCAVA